MSNNIGLKIPSEVLTNLVNTLGQKSQAQEQPKSSGWFWTIAKGAVIVAIFYAGYKYGCQSGFGKGMENAAKSAGELFNKYYTIVKDNMDPQDINKFKTFTRNFVEKELVESSSNETGILSNITNLIAGGSENSIKDGVEQIVKNNTPVPKIIESNTEGSEYFVDNTGYWLINKVYEYPRTSLFLYFSGIVPEALTLVKTNALFFAKTAIVKTGKFVLRMP